MLYEIISWIVFGALAGWIASLLTGTREGLLGSIVVGILGAFIGGFLLRLFGIGVTAGSFSLVGLLAAVIGAVILLWIMRSLRTGSHA